MSEPRVADLELQVRREDDDVEFFLRINGLDRSLKNARGRVRLTGEELLKIDKKTKTTAKSPRRRSDARRWRKNLRALGKRYFRDLLPESLQSRFLEIDELVRRDGITPSLIIYSDSTPVSIPWEIIHLGVARGDRAGTFLCNTFNISHWTDQREAFEIPLKRIALIGDPNAPQVAEEREFFEQLPDVDVTLVNSEASFEEIANRSFDSWHFSTHGDDSRIQLRRNEWLTADDLDTLSFRNRPLVFLNLCSSANFGPSRFSWTLLETLIQSDIGALIGTRWPITGEHAALFSKTFYEAFLAGDDFGQAIGKARRAAHTENDSTALSYVAFGHPKARYLKPADEPHPTPTPSNTGIAGDDETPPARRRQSVEPNGTPTDNDTVPPEPSRPDIPPTEGLRFELLPDDFEYLDGSTLCRVPAGQYTLGDPNISDSAPDHVVLLTEFWIGKYPITNSQFERFLDSIKTRPRPVSWKRKGFDHPDQPVVGIDLADCLAYCRWAGLSLPTEAQWEAAARGNDERIYPWGGEDPTDAHAYFGKDQGGPQPVGLLPLGVGPFGTHDMAGNVLERCRDSWSARAYQNRHFLRDPVNELKSDVGIVRGGAWNSLSSNLKAATRSYQSKNAKPLDLGFRPILVRK